MAELTQADIDKAIKDAVATAKAETKAELQEAFDAETQGLKDKNRELLGKLREASGVKPEDLQSAEADRDKAQAELADAQKQIKALTGERDKLQTRAETAEKAGMEQARNSVIAGEIAKGNLVPALVDGYTARVEKLAVTEWKDGAWKTTIDGKDAGEWVRADLDSDNGKAYRAAALNGGGGAPGGGGSQGGKTIPRTQFDALSAAAKVEFGKEGGKVVDQAA